MSFTVHPVTPTFAAEIGDLDLSAPLDDAVIAGLEDAFNAYSVLIFPDQELSEAAQLAFSARFGPLETTIQKFRPGVKLRLDPQFADVSNIGADDKRAAAVQFGQPAVAYRQLVPSSAVEMLAALWPLDPAGRRADRIRRSARCL
jgi:hypothetical protein